MLLHLVGHRFWYEYLIATFPLLPVTVKMAVIFLDLQLFLHWPVFKVSLNVFVDFANSIRIVMKLNLSIETEHNSI